MPTVNLTVCAIWGSPFGLTATMDEDCNEGSEEADKQTMKRLVALYREAMAHRPADGKSSITF